jgi:hypothetical protein
MSISGLDLAAWRLLMPIHLRKLHMTGATGNWGADL